jgi:hypothetical protein
MISELLSFLLTPCPAYVRRMGYLSQAIALKGRYRRRRASWQFHLEKSKAFVIETSVNCPKKERVIVLGSGLLLDVPLDELSRLFGEVILVDIVHLSQVMRSVRDYPNVRLVQADITGIAEKLFEDIARGRRQLPESEPVIPESNGSASLVISLNIISQLSVIPIDYIRAKTSTDDETLMQAWCDRMRKAHIQALQKIGCDACLLSDHKFIYRDVGGAIIEHGSTVGELELPVPDRLWTWDIAPRGEIGPKISKELIVGAWHFKKTV